MIKRRAFTLVEIMIVIAIIGVMSSMVLPRFSFYNESQVLSLQRFFDELSSVALSGTPVRVSIKSDRFSTSKTGSIFVESFRLKEVPEDSLAAFLGHVQEVSEWQELKTQNHPDGEFWKFSPEIIYFYSDGSCSPCEINYLENDRKAVRYVLTVTGYCFEIESDDF